MRRCIGGLEAAELLEDLGIGFGRAGTLGPAAHDPSRPLPLPRSPGGDNDLDGQASSPERMPEPALPPRPGTGRGHGLVAGVGLATRGSNCFVTISMSLSPEHGVGKTRAPRHRVGALDAFIPSVG